MFQFLYLKELFISIAGFVNQQEKQDIFYLFLYIFLFHPRVKIFCRSKKKLIRVVATRNNF